jgi:hypothetical protein
VVQSPGAVGHGGVVKPVFGEHVSFQEQAAHHCLNPIVENLQQQR